MAEGTLDNINFIKKNTEPPDCSLEGDCLVFTVVCSE